MPRSGATAASEREVAVPDVGAARATAPPPACDAVRAALEAGVVSRRMLFPEDGPARTVEIWRAPVIEDKAVGTAVWSRLAELEAWMSPAPRRELMSRILVLLAHYRAASHADAVEQGLADDWAEDLAAYPMWAVDEAARMWRRTRKFRPQISEMIELCEAQVSAVSVERRRLQSIVDAAARIKNPISCRTDELARTLVITAV